MKRFQKYIGIGLIGILGCAGVESDYKYFKKLVEKAPASISRIYGGYTAGYMNKLNCGICYRISEPGEEKLIIGLLSYFNTHYNGFLEKAIKKTNEKMDKDGPFYNCITLYGLERAAQEVVGAGYEKEMDNALRLLSLGECISKIKVIGSE